MVEQLTVFIENSKGRLAALCKALGQAGISMHALMVADTEEYGVARIICDTPHDAIDTLRSHGFTCSLAEVLAVNVDNKPGGISAILETLSDVDESVNYAYCFLGRVAGSATVVLKVCNCEKSIAALTANDFTLLEPVDLYRLDGE